MPGPRRSTSCTKISPELSRRELLLAGACALGTAAFWPRHAFAADEPAWLAAARVSPLVYVSPLLKDGAESRCHGEVWFFVDAGDVVLATATKTWKAQALALGRDRARIWVGDFGPYSKAPEKVAKAPSFVASASLDKDRAVFDRLLAAYAVKYADEWGKWKPRFESSYADGSRVVIRYKSIPA
jgi:hypothetical protein